MRLEAIFPPAVVSEVDIENLSQALGLDKDGWPPTPEPLVVAAGEISMTSTSTDVSLPAMSTDSESTDNKPPSSIESRQPTNAVTSDGLPSNGQLIEARLIALETALAWSAQVQQHLVAALSDFLADCSRPATCRTSPRRWST